MHPTLTDSLCFQRYFRVCVTSCAYGGDRGLRGKIFLCRHLQPSRHHHLGTKPKHITPTDRQVPDNMLRVILDRSFGVHSSSMYVSKL